jgi:hypothetical protein
MMFLNIKESVSQGYFSYVNNDLENGIVSAITTNGDSLVVVGMLNSGCFNTSTLSVFGRSGALLWSIPSYFSTIEQIEIRNGFIYTSGGSLGGDIPSEDARFGKYSLNGDSVYNILYPGLYAYPGKVLPNLMDVNSKGIVAATTTHSPWNNPIETGYFLLNNTGMVIKDDSLKLNGKAKLLKYISDTSLYLVSETSLYLLDDTMNIQDSMNLGREVLSAYFHDTSLYVFSSDEILRFNGSMERIDSISTKLSKESFKVAEQNDTLFIQEIVGGQIKVWILNDMVWTDSLMFDSLLSNIHFDRYGDEFVFAGSTMRNQSAIYQLQRGETVPTSEVPNIEINEVAVHDVSAKYQDISFPDEPEKLMYMGYCLKYNALVKNLGNDTIFNFGIRTDTYTEGSVCGWTYYEKINVSIPPGEEKWLNDIDACQSYKMDISFCVDVMAPNSKLESDQSTNQFCDSYGTVSSVQISYSELNMYPNPTNSHLYFGMDEVNYKIMDRLGAFLLTGKGFAVNVSSLSSGVYFILLDGGDSQNVHRFVKI